MPKKRSLVVVPMLAICAGLGALTALVGFQAAPAAAVKTPVAKPATVVVTAGKPTELAFKLSTKSVPAGKVIFKVTNKGHVAHSFKVCSNPKGGNGNACVGHATKLLEPGQSATLTVVLKKGKYEYLCTVPGHAAAGMKGEIGVGGVKVPTTTVAAATTTTAAATTTTAATTAATATTTVATTTAATTTAAAATCTSNASTTVTVSAVEFSFTLSQTTVPCGTVTFQVTDNGQAIHNFHVESASGTGVSGDTVGPFLNPGQSATQVMMFTQPGSYTYLCDVPGHARLGMIGTLTVTP